VARHCTIKELGHQNSHVDNFLRNGLVCGLIEGRALGYRRGTICVSDSQRVQNRGFSAEETCIGRRDNLVPRARES